VALPPAARPLPGGVLLVLVVTCGALRPIHNDRRPTIDVEQLGGERKLSAMGPSASDDRSSHGSDDSHCSNELTLFALASISRTIVAEMALDSTGKPT
jgi:hypothetical protein